MKFEVKKINDKYIARLIDFDITAEGNNQITAYLNLLSEMNESAYSNVIATISTNEFGE